MKKILHIILISFFSFTIISCAKESTKKSSSTTTTMSTPTIADGNYKLSAVSLEIYYSSGSYYGSATYTINHDTNVTPGYTGYGMAWQGSGVYRITVFGKSTWLSGGSVVATLDCTTNNIADTTLDTDGNMTGETLIQTGCGGVSSTLTTVSVKYSAISGGFTKYAVAEDSSYQYRYTYTSLKQ